jgi:hypothetical protein
MTKYDDMVAVLRVVRDHESVKDPAKACSPCDVTGLAVAIGLEPQEVADRLDDARKRGRMITARETKGATQPYFDQIRLSANGRAAVQKAQGNQEGGAGSARPD